MTITVVRTLPETTWRQFVEQHPVSNVYHTPEMFQTFARVAKHRPTLWAAVEAERPLALLLPVEVTLLNGPFRPFTTRAIVYGSVLAAPGPTGAEALRMLLKTYQRQSRGLLFTELRNVADLSLLQPVLNDCGLRYEGHLNFLLDLTAPEEAVWRKLSKSGQQSVRTARNKGTVIEEVTDRSILPQVYTLLQKVYTRARVPLAPPSLFEAAFDVLGPRGMFKILVAQANGESIGVCLLLAYKDRVVYWYGGLDREWAAYAPMEALLWRAIQWGQSQGYAIFDFGGAGRPEEEYGPRKFKAKFGGELVEYGRNTYVHSKVRLQLSQYGYSFLRRYL